jgi:hypothetical protein
MSPLRARMIEDMTLAGLTWRSIEGSWLQVSAMPSRFAGQRIRPRQSLIRPASGCDASCNQGHPGRCWSGLGVTSTRGVCAGAARREPPCPNHI